ncbi:precorrin-2 dehydrogenase/sirohydrochlorin ferrochelatase family protein [Bacillus sp. JJ722]|uniref:precorrin-2 dehydrogenase/sirohydrochlorin ferrochelatase family protein n=1 Tax=Bacillus sp. JJ722 TaxID=3122973 RepID=UPI002FFE6C37
MYPIMLDVTNKPIVIVGGGRIALRKAKGLVKEGAAVTIVSPKLVEGFAELNLSWKQKKYEASDLEGAFLVLACTDNMEVNRQVRKDAAPNQLVNITSEQGLSNFHNMAVVEHEECVIAISTRGASPSRAKQLRMELEDWLREQ